MSRAELWSLYSNVLCLVAIIHMRETHKYAKYPIQIQSSSTLKGIKQTKPSDLSLIVYYTWKHVHYLKKITEKKAQKQNKKKCMSQKPSPAAGTNVSTKVLYISHQILLPPLNSSHGSLPNQLPSACHLLKSSFLLDERFTWVFRVPPPREFWNHWALWTAAAFCCCWVFSTKKKELFGAKIWWKLLKT